METKGKKGKTTTPKEKTTKEKTNQKMKSFLFEADFFFLVALTFGLEGYRKCLKN